MGQGKIVGTDIGTHVVDHDEQDIFGGGGACGEEGGEEEEEEESHRVVRHPGQGTELFAAYAGSFCLAHALQCLSTGARVRLDLLVYLNLLLFDVLS